MQHAGDNAQTRPTTTPRRTLFRGTAAVLGAALLPAACQREAVAATPADGEDDAELLAVCQAFAAVHREQEAWDAGAIVLDDDAADRLVHRWHAPLEQLTSMPARTAAAVRAKAEAAYCAMQSAEDGCFGSAEAAAMSVLRDIVGEG